MTEQISKTELMDRITAGYEALERVLRGLDDAQLSRSGSDEGWAIKDHLFHLAAWERGIAWLLGRRSRTEGMEIKMCIRDRSCSIRGSCPRCGRRLAGRALIPQAAAAGNRHMKEFSARL